MPDESKEIYRGESQDLDYDVIITDAVGVVGLEFNRIVVTLTGSEHFLSYASIASLSRCQQELYFLVFQDRLTNLNPITANIIKAWEDRSLVDKKTIVKTTISDVCICGNLYHMEVKPNYSDGRDSIFCFEEDFAESDNKGISDVKKEQIG